MKILTGKTGTPHVTSQQFRQLVEGTVGQESYILTSGENLEPELSSNNLLKIRSGMMSHHGNLSTVEIGTYDEVTIQNGTQGMKRIDLVVNRYTKNDETGIEENEWVVIMGTPDADSPVAPAYMEGNLQEGDLVDDCPVFEVHLDGINVTEVKKLLSVSPDIPTLNAYLSDLSSKIPEEDDGYLKFADGTLIQWGRATVGSNGAAIVEFSIPFVNTSYCIQATPEYYSGTPTFTLSTQRSTVSRMIIYARSTAGAVISGVNVYWVVTGRWK